MILTYEIDDIPPSINNFLGRNVRWKYQVEKKRWADKIKLALDKIPDEPFKKSTVRITYTFPTKRRHDPDNYAGKFILDPLVENGVIADDDFEHMHLQVFGNYEKGVKRTKITIIER